jgi:hypothetical protein
MFALYSFRGGASVPKKTYVSAGHDTDELGVITPLWIVFCGTKYDIDRVLDVRQAASAAGGFGTRFTVRIGKKQTYVFLDSYHRWFVEEKVPNEPARADSRFQGETYRF